jgi:mono/diheme cytochrome c family protein
VSEPKKDEIEEPFSDARVRDEVNVANIHGSILREQEDPEDGYEPIPFWLITLFFGIIFWAGMYLAYNSGGFRADVFNPTQVAWEGGTSGPAAPPDPLVIGKRLYTANCVSCHQTTGAGVAGQFPPLVGSEWVLAGDWHGDNHLVKVLLQGLQGAIQVKGNTYNNAMPPWKQLKDDQIASILTYIRSEWGNNAPAITAEFVAKIREETGARTEPWTQAELKAIPRVLISDGGAAAPAEAAPAAPAEGTAPAPEAAPAAPAGSAFSPSISSQPGV